MPLGKVDSSSLFWNPSEQPYASLDEARKAGAPVVAYGLFINNMLGFLIVALVIFLVVKQINRLRKEPDTQTEPVTKECPFCASTISLKASRCPNCTSQLQDAAPVLTS